ncbi:MAG: RNA-binding domain-containing protein [Tissierellaceae bacterium]
MIENSRIEFKRELNSKLEKEVVGFLNNQEGGIIYIGLDDRGEVYDIEDLDGTQLKIIDRIRDGILPSPLGLFDVVIEEIDNKEIIKIIISSGTEKPYYIKKYGLSPAGSYIRIGSSTQQMTTSLIDDLYSRRVRNSLNRILSPRQDLTFAQLKIYYEENGLSLNDNFAKNLELLTEDGKYNYNAYLLADNNGLSMKVAKYKGTDKVDLIENAEFGYCSIVKATNNILDKLELENITKTKITSKLREERRLVDPRALREAAINAIVHNDYSTEIPPLFEIFSDKIVITSTGGLPQNLTEKGFFSGISAPRNKELMRAFKDLKLVEHLGSGMLRILSKYDRSIFTFLGNFLKVSFMFEKDSVDENVGKSVGKDVGEINIKLNKNQEKILAEIAKDNRITQKRISKILNISDRTVQRNTLILQKKGLLKRIGPANGGYWEIAD